MDLGGQRPPAAVIRALVQVAVHQVCGQFRGGTCQVVVGSDDRGVEARNGALKGLLRAPALVGNALEHVLKTGLVSLSASAVRHRQRPLVDDARQRTVDLLGAGVNLG